MYPIICELGFFKVYSYGLMLAIAIMICSYLLSRDVAKIGISKETIYDIIFLVVISGIIGARVFYIILNLDFFLDNPLEMIMIQNGGLAWQGGLIAGFIASVFFIKNKKLPFLRILDAASPYIALGQSIGRIGCFLNGCCYGKEISWGIYSSLHDAHIYPTQLYSSLGLFVIFIILKRYQKPDHKSGKVFVLYLFLASILRFIIEFFRGDHSVLVLGLSIYQFVCIFIFFSALIVFLKIKK